MNIEFQKREVERAAKWLKTVKKGYKLKIIQLEKAQKAYDTAIENLKKIKENEEK